MAKAVVSPSEPPDLTGEDLRVVQAAILLLLGGRDKAVLMLNNEARARMSRNPKLEIVPGARYLFEEPRTLEPVAPLASRWFQENLAAALT